MSILTARDVSVVMCAYTEQRWDALNYAINGVKRLAVPPGEIILVVDHNHKLFERALAEIPGIEAVENTQRQGLSGARNSGVVVAQGRVVAFLDEDASPATDWLEWLVAGYDDPNVLGVGGAVEPVWENGRPTWFPPEFDWVVGCSYLGLPTRTAQVRNLIGCNMSLRRELFKVIGGFRETLGRVRDIPLSCEETEFCIRAQQQLPGRKFCFEPRARVFHNVSTNRSGLRYFILRSFHEGASKALVSRIVGTTDGLSSERFFLTNTLTHAIARELARGFLHHDWTGLRRTGAIVTGLGAATAGYLATWASKPEESERLERKNAAAQQPIP